MPPENIDTVRRALGAINDRDVGEYLSCCSEDIELASPASALEGAYVGRPGIRRFFADIEEYGPDFRLDIDSIEAIGADRVIAFLHATATGRASGAATSQRLATVYDLADGRIRHIRVFQDPAAAIEAARLPE